MGATRDNFAGLEVLVARRDDALLLNLLVTGAAAIVAAALMIVLTFAQVIGSDKDLDRA